MVSSVTEETKELIIHSNDEAGFVEVTPTCTLSEVRKLILEDFDVEQLPSQSEEFAFKVNGVRQSHKQEGRKNAFELHELQATIEIIPRVNDRKRKMIDTENMSANKTVDKANDSISGSNKKKLKLDTSCAVTPFQSSSSTGDSKKSAAKDKRNSGNDNGNAAGSGEMSTTGTIDTATNSSIGPTDLDKKKFSSNNGNEEQKHDSGVDTNEMNVETEQDDDKTVSMSGSQDSIGDGLVTDGKHDDDDIISGAQADNSDDDKDDNDNDENNEIRHDAGKDGRVKSYGILDSFGEVATYKGIEDEATEDGADKERTSAEQRTDADSSDDELMQDIEKDANAEMGNEADALIAETNPHKEADEAKEKSRQVLKELTDMLNNNPNFCSETRKDDWMDEINQLTKKSSPQTIFGVLGNTGV